MIHSQLPYGYLLLSLTKFDSEYFTRIVLCNGYGKHKPVEHEEKRNASSLNIRFGGIFLPV